jgi:hypothetical protein
MGCGRSCNSDDDDNHHYSGNRHSKEGIKLREIWNLIEIVHRRKAFEDGLDRLRRGISLLACSVSGIKARHSLIKISRLCNHMRLHLNESVIAKIPCSCDKVLRGLFSKRRKRRILG